MLYVEMSPKLLYTRQSTFCQVSTKFNNELKQIQIICYLILDKVIGHNTDLNNCDNLPVSGARQTLLVIMEPLCERPFQVLCLILSHTEV